MSRTLSKIFIFCLLGRGFSSITLALRIASLWVMIMLRDVDKLAMIVKLGISPFNNAEDVVVNTFPRGWLQGFH